MGIRHAALVFGLSGLMSAGFFYLRFGFGEPKWLPWFFPAAGLSAAITGGIGWWIVSRYRVKMGLWSAGAFGMAVALVAHPLFWFLVLTGAYAFEVRGSLGQRTVSPFSLNAIWGSLVYSLFSIRLAGLITFPVGAIAGLVLVLLDRYHVGRPST